MRVVVDVNVLRIKGVFETIEVNALPVVLAYVVTDDRVAVPSLHDPAEPQIVVAVVVLDKGIDAVVIGVESASIPSSFAHVSIGLVILNLDAVRVKAEDAVPRIVSTAVGQDVALVNGVLAHPRDDTVASGVVDKIVRHVNLRPQVVGDRIVLSKFDAPAVRSVTDPHTPDPDNAVIRDTKIVHNRRFQSFDMDVDAAALLAGHFPVDIVYSAIVDVDMFVCAFSPIDENVNPE